MGRKSKKPPAEGDASNFRPVQPSQSQTTQPSQTQPTEPSQAQPSQPSQAQPTQPSQVQPSRPPVQLEQAQSSQEFSKKKKQKFKKSDFSQEQHTATQHVPQSIQPVIAHPAVPPQAAHPPPTQHTPTAPAQSVPRPHPAVPSQAAHPPLAQHTPNAPPQSVPRPHPAVPSQAAHPPLTQHTPTAPAQSVPRPPWDSRTPQTPAQAVAAITETMKQVTVKSEPILPTSAPEGPPVANPDKGKNAGKGKKSTPKPSAQSAASPPQAAAPAQKATPAQGATPAHGATSARISTAPTSTGPPQPGPQTVARLETSGGLKVPMRRGNTGKKLGRKIFIETNYLPLIINAKGNGVHYDVSIVPDKPPRMLVHVMDKFIKKVFPGKYPAFDGQKNLYSSGPLPMPSGSVTQTIEMLEEGRNDPMKFQVTVKWASNIDFSSLSKYMKQGSSQDAPQRAISCLDVILRHSPLLKFVKVGRSFFTKPEGQVIDLGGGQEMWYGIFQSAILGWKPFINVDIAHKGFPKRQNVVDLIQELSRYNIRDPKRLDSNTVEELRKFIKTMKVEFEIPGNSSSRRTYRVNDVMPPPGEINFTVDDGKKYNVTQYFQVERKYRLQYPHLPCLWVGSRNSPRKICFPVELCTVVPGQVIIRKLDGMQTSKMIRASAAPADERKRKVMDAIKSMKYNQDPVLKEFGLRVTEEFEKVEGRVIKAPALEYGGSQRVEPRNGQWFASRFREPVKLQNWMILDMCRLNRRDIDTLSTSIVRMGFKVGMEISAPVIKSDIQPKDLKSLMMDAAKNNVQMVMAIVSEWGNNYAMVKQIAELECGVLTQCIKNRTVTQMSDNTASQLLLKMNSKLNGANHALHLEGMPRCLKKPCMIMGADVTHPAPGQMNEPSLAAVVASHDPKAFKYNITIRMQPPKVEIISDLKSMVKEQLMFFYKKTSQKPHQIIFFRDGVSEGQFEMVLNCELMAIRAACSELEKTYQPQISFFVVQKRHHTRFFAVDPRDKDKNQNVPVGTCIDSVITHPTEFDFYLLSHASIKGTARPTRYRCLWDDANMPEDEVEELAFQLCHLYTRCNRSVSYPAPTYYAHLAAARAKVYTEGKQLDMDHLQSQQNLLNIVDMVRKERPMFFV